MKTELGFDLGDPWQGLPDKFNSDWRAISRMRECSVTEVDTFLSMHYLQCRPAVVVLCLMLMCKETPAGAVVYALPPPECFTRYGGLTWELARLYLLQQIPRNAETWLIGKSVRYIQRNRRDVHCLVSYADPAAGHSGTIYKAANWTPDGMTGDGRVTARADYFDAQGRKYARRSHVPRGVAVESKPRQSKHRFFFRLAGSK